jgi:hypothetical protein
MIYKLIDGSQSIIWKPSLLGNNQKPTLLISDNA